MQVQRWPVGPTGLRYDREWALVDDAGHVVTQKLCPRAALVMPCVDLDARTLTIAAPKGPPPPSAGSSSTGARLGPLVVSLDEGSAGDAREEEERDGAAGQGQEEGPQQQQERTIRVCGDTVCGLVVTQSVTLTSSSSSSSSSSAATGPPQSARAVMRAWFQAALGVPCVLVRQREGARAARAGTGGTGRGAGPEPASSQAAHGSGQAQPRASIGFANDGQFLLVNAASVDDVNARLAAAAMAKAASEVAAPPLQGSSSSSSSVALPFAVPTSPVELLRCAAVCGECCVRQQCGLALQRDSVWHVRGRTCLCCAGSVPTWWWRACLRTPRTPGDRCRCGGRTAARETAASSG